MSNAIRATTRENYANNLKPYLAACSLHNLPPFPATDVSIAAFLVHALQGDRIHGNSIHSYISAIKKQHLLLTHTELNLSPVTQQALQGFKHLSAEGQVHQLRYALTAADYVAITNATIDQPVNLTLQKAHAFVSLGFLFLLRAASIAAIRARDITFTLDADSKPIAILLHVRHQKTATTFAPPVRKPFDTRHRHYDTSKFPDFLTPLYAYYQRRQQQGKHYLFLEAVDPYHDLPLSKLPPSDAKAHKAAPALITAALTTALSAAGIVAPDFNKTTSHALRRGGAAELQAISKDVRITQLWGNWKQAESVLPYLNLGNFDTPEARHIFGFLLPS